MLQQTSRPYQIFVDNKLSRRKFVFRLALPPGMRCRVTKLKAIQAIMMDQKQKLRPGVHKIDFHKRDHQTLLIFTKIKSASGTEWYDHRDLLYAQLDDMITTVIEAIDKVATDQAQPQLMRAPVFTHTKAFKPNHRRKQAERRIQRRSRDQFKKNATTKHAAFRDILPHADIAVDNAHFVS